MCRKTEIRQCSLQFRGDSSRRLVWHDGCENGWMSGYRTYVGHGLRASTPEGGPGSQAGAKPRPGVASRNRVRKLVERGSACAGRETLRALRPCAPAAFKWVTFMATRFQACKCRVGVAQTGRPIRAVYSWFLTLTSAVPPWRVLRKKEQAVLQFRHPAPAVHYHEVTAQQADDDWSLRTSTHLIANTW